MTYVQVILGPCRIGVCAARPITAWPHFTNHPARLNFFSTFAEGPQTPVGDEFAWGNSNIHGVPYTLINEGTPAEQISNPGSGVGNANYNTTNGSPSGPKRCGIFAASALLNNREETGGSYYGIMELTGNVYERAITVGNPAKVVLSQDYTAMEVLPVPELPTSRTGRLLMWGSATGAAVTPMEHNLFRFPTAMMLPIVFLVPMAG